MVCIHSMGGCRSTALTPWRAALTDVHRSKAGWTAVSRSTGVSRSGVGSRVAYPSTGGSRAGCRSRAWSRRQERRPSTNRHCHAGPSCRCRCDDRRCRSCRCTRCSPDRAPPSAVAGGHRHDPGSAQLDRSFRVARKYCCSAVRLHMRSDADECRRLHPGNSRVDNPRGSLLRNRTSDRDGRGPGPTNPRKGNHPNLQNRYRR